MKIKKVIDIKEADILKKYPGIIDILLCDQTTKQNIFWATENYYQQLENDYHSLSPITVNLITGSNGNVIMPRVLKNKSLQRARTKDMGEVYTSSWVCNEQNNVVDKIWFNKENVFNKRIIKNDGSMSWEVNENKVKFPKDKTWKDYVSDIRLEVACGEAPYLTSRYDATNGKYISVKNRVGLLDRKLRIITENIKTKKSWLNNVELAYQSVYGYEFHGDSLLLARESLLYTFMDNYFEKFNTEPKLQDVQKIAYIISWNIWQMDGLRCVVPDSCVTTVKEEKDLFGDTINNLIECEGCNKNKHHIHNGIYCLIMDWRKNGLQSNEKGQVIRFIDMLKDEGGR